MKDFELKCINNDLPSGTCTDFKAGIPHIFNQYINNIHLGCLFRHQHIYFRFSCQVAPVLVDIANKIIKALGKL